MFGLGALYLVMYFQSAVLLNFLDLYIYQQLTYYAYRLISPGTVIFLVFILSTLFYGCLLCFCYSESFAV